MKKFTVAWIMLSGLVFLALVMLRSPVTAQDGGTTERVSIASTGSQADQRSVSPALSADGRYVAFWSDATNLVTGDTNALADVFVHDRDTGQTERVSVASDGTQANGASYYPALSANGWYVAFVSFAENLVPDDSNGWPDIFVRDRQSGQTERISVASDGSQGNGPASGPVRFSADGRYIVFSSAASNLVPDDTNHWSDVFVHDQDTGQTQRVSVSNSGAQANDASYEGALSADGRYVVFVSHANNLVPDDTNGSADIFVADRDTGQVERVSVSSSGTQANTYSAFSSISDDGQWVVFASYADNLVPGDTNHAPDVFVRDRQSGQTTRVSITPSGSQFAAGSYHPSISADGRSVVFAVDVLAGSMARTMYVWDRQTGETEPVAPAGGGHSQEPAVSGNGAVVAFRSSVSTLVADDTNGVEDIFVSVRGITPLLPAPTALTATQVSPTQIDLTWTDNSGDETAFHIERSPDGLTEWAEIGTVGADVTAYSDSTVTCDTPYFYQVRAYRAGDSVFSEDSNVASATTGLCQMFVVTSADDVSDGTCEPAPGHCSLREAILAANENPDRNTIEFALPSYPAVIVLTADLPAIAADLTITGPGSGHLTVDGDNDYRPFTIDAGATVTLEGVTVRGGYSAYGAGVYIAGGAEVTINDSVITDCYGTWGAGIWNNGSLTMNYVEIRDNRTHTGGGTGLYNESAGTAIITYSTIAANSSFSGEAGGITNNGVLIFNNSTLTGNLDSFMVGGVYNTGTLTFTNSTVSGNGSGYGGGGVYSSGVVEAVHTTFAGNIPDGITNEGGTFLVIRSVLADVVDNCVGDAISDGGYNISNDTSCGFSGDGIDPTLGPLTYNDGPTKTHALLSSSPAIDLIPTEVCVVSVDQRGVSRPQDGDGDGSAGCDAGAVERRAAFEAPGTLTALAVSTSQIDLAWNDVNEDETAYHVERSPDGTTDWNEIAAIAAGVTSYSDGGLACGTTYFYRVRAYRAGDGIFSEYSNVASATTDPCASPLLVVTSADDVSDGTCEPAPGHCSLREAILAANEDGLGWNSIEFALPSFPAVITLTADLPVIAGNLVITGPGAAELAIDGTGSYRPFLIEDWVTATIDAVTITHGKATVEINGGAILNNGTLRLTHSILTDNSTMSFGGAIANMGTLTVIGSAISGNSAEYGGGGIANDGILTITTSTISGNDTLEDPYFENGGSGSGLYNDERSSATIMDSTISGNSAEDNGGGISNANILTIIGSTISGNNAKRNGGGIYNSVGTVTIISSTVSDNSALSCGGLCNTYGTVTIFSSTFLGNYAAPDASGWGGRTGAIGNGGILVVSGSTFSDNSAFASPGGAISNWGTGTITTSTFSGNSAMDSGGAIYNETGTLSITAGTFFGNSAPASGTIHSDADPVYSGDAIRNETGTVYLAGNVFQHATDGDNCSDLDTLIDNGYNLSDDDSCGFAGPGSANNAVLNLGPLSEGGPGQQVHTPIAPSYVIGAIPNGTIIDNNGVTLACNGTTTDQLGASRPINPGTACASGAVEVVPSVVCNPVRILTADELALCITEANATPATLDTLTLGADITLTAALPDVSNPITLEGANHFVSGGNAVRVFRITDTGDLTLNEITVQNGNTDEDGGGVYNEGTLTMTNSTFSSNASTDDGGGIYNEGTLRVTTSTLSDNSSNGPYGCGGGIYNMGVLEVTDSTFTSNTTRGSGGGIFNLSGERMLVTNSAFTGNTAHASGGGIYNYDGMLAVINSTFSDNAVTNDSGGAGGGLSNFRGTVTVANSTFSHNSAVSAAGIVNSGGGTLIVTNSTFSGNSATHGGGVFNYESTLTMTSSTFSGNSATTDSGISNYNGIVHLAGTIFGAASGDNCAGSVIDNGYNLSDDDSCSFSGTGSLNTATLNLDLLSSGGPGQQVHTPVLPSDAIGAIPNGTTINNNGVILACNGTTTDQLGQDRPINLGDDCTSGAVEVVPSAVCDPANILTEDDLTHCINEANATPATLDMLTLGAGITLTKVLPDISSPITLEGANHYVDGNHSVRVFYVTSTGELTLSGITVQNGNVSGYGGGIYNDHGTMAMVNSTFSGNSAYYGGGIFNNRGTLTVTNSALFANSASRYGGGIYTYDGTVTVTNSTFSGNSAHYGGGGINNHGGTLMVSNSTFSGNSAIYSGGGINTYYATVYLIGTIFDTGTGNNCAGSVVDNGYNLSDDDSCHLAGIGSLNSATLNLGPLKGDGPGQQLHTPIAPSVAIRAIPNGTTINNNGVTLACNGTTADQLGATRPINPGTACTAGAVEVATTDNLVRNGDFSANESEWNFFGEIGHGVNAGVMEMYRQTPSPSGAAMWQVLGYAPPADASFEVTLDIGNTSAVPKEMWVTLRQPDWSDFMTCYFSMAAGSPMASVTMYGHTQMAWIDMVLEIAPSPADSIPAIQIDNVTVLHRTDLAITESSCVSSNLPPSGNLLLNPTFDTGTDDWTFWGEIGYAWNPGGDVSFWRETPSPFGAAIYQDLNYTTLANAPFEVTADLANDSDVVKDIWLTLRSPDWTDYFNCRFTLEPHAPMTNYTMRGRSTTGWSGIRLEIVPGPADSIPSVRVDNVTVDHKPSLDTFVTECVRSQVPQHTELVKNGDFSVGENDWYLWGDVERTVVSGVLNFWRTATVTAGGAVIFQDLNVQTPAGAPFEVNLDLGNSSGVNKHMWVTLRNYDWSDYFTCYFELPASAPLDTYTMRGETSIPWSNMRLELWAGPPDGVPALLADNISVLNNPALTPVGVECNVPGGAPGELVLEQPEITPTPEATVELTIEPAILETVESDDSRVTQNGEWTAHETDLASGGGYVFSSGNADDTLSLSFSGTQLDVVYVQHPALGVFAVEVDGAVMQTVDSAAEEAAFGASVAIDGLAEGEHVVRIVPISGTIAIDAFVVEAQAETPVEPTPVPTEVMPTATPTVEPTEIIPTATPADALDTIESDDARVVQSGLWTLTPGELASGGATLISSGSADDTLTLTFTGPRLDVVYVKHPALGTFTIEVDGAVLYTVTSAGEQNEFGAVVSLNGLGDGVHTLRIAPVNGTIAIDAFVVEPQGEIPVVPTPEPTEVIPTQAPTDGVPTATPVPTELPPTATPEPTEAPPTVAPVPTEPPAVTPVCPSRPGVGS